ncbi:MAG TPA: hypothetical protein VD902_06025, partial [Symbiobacteriaceae bacterium]|nr:hypothetical protein [Symbiobacteriaceae bacterium]
AWSDVLWPEAEAGPPAYADYASFEELCQHTDNDVRFGIYNAEFYLWPKEWRKIHRFELDRLDEFKRTLPLIRRALANVPVYMVFDDHEVTDDWYLNREWCIDALSHPNGQRVIANGMTALTVFQSWGNTPEQFEPPASGETNAGYLLRQAVTNYHGGDTPEQLAKAAQLDNLLGMPAVLDGQLAYPPPGSPRVAFHYHIQRSKYEIIALDTRTMRDYPGEDPQAPPEMLNTEAYSLQIPPGPSPAGGVTMVIAPTNLVSEWLTEFGVELLLKFKSVYDPDAGDAWTGQSHGFEKFLARLADRAPNVTSGARQARVAVLSGDIHYAFAQRLQYWARRPYESPEGCQPVNAIFAELVASSFRNQQFKTTALHEEKINTVHSIRWLGWQEPPSAEQVRLRWQPNWTELNPDLWRFRRRPAMLRDYVINVQSQVNVRPDWRYRIDMVGDTSGPLTESSGYIATYTDGPAEFWLNQYKLMYLNLHYALRNVNLGRYIVGYNNMGEIQFIWGDGRHGSEVAGDDDKWVVQYSWWHRPGDVFPHPHNMFKVPLRFTMDLERYPKPLYLGEAEEE